MKNKPVFLKLFPDLAASIVKGLKKEHKMNFCSKIYFAPKAAIDGNVAYFFGYFQKLFCLISSTFLPLSRFYGKEVLLTMKLKMNIFCYNNRMSKEIVRPHSTLQELLQFYPVFIYILIFRNNETCI